MNLYTELDELLVIRNKVINKEIPDTNELDALYAALLNKQEQNMSNPKYNKKPWLKDLSSSDESLILRLFNNIGTDAPDIIRGLKAIFYTYTLSAAENQRFFGKDTEED